MTGTLECSCGTPLQPVMSATDPDSVKFGACPHCDRVCTAKVCARCRQAGVKS